MNLDFENQEWRLQAKCRGVATELFFPERTGPDVTRAAKEICFSCPVRVECLDYALEAGEKFGVFGGLSERGRRKLRVERYAEKGYTRHGRPPSSAPLTERVCANRYCKAPFMPTRDRQLCCDGSCAASYRAQQRETPWDFAQSHKRRQEGL